GGQAARPRASRTAIPPIPAVASAQDVVKLQNLADPFPVVVDLRVEAPRGRRHDLAAGRQLRTDEGSALLDQRERGGFERLDEAARQSHGDAVPDPEVAPKARFEPDRAKREILRPDLRRGAPYVLPEDLAGPRFVRVRGGIDVPDAAARLQADVPDPAGLHGGGPGRGCNRLVRPAARHLHGDRGVVEQALLHRHESDAEMAADQQRTRTGAVHEQVPVQAPARIEHERPDVAARRQLHVLYVAREVFDAEL